MTCGECSCIRHNNGTQAGQPSPELIQHFGNNAAEAQRVLNALDTAPTVAFRAEDVLAAAGITSIVTGMMILARLTYVRMIDHPDLGVYQALNGSRQGLRRPA